jgi:hypothetical protein
MMVTVVVTVVVAKMKKKKGLRRRFNTGAIVGSIRGSCCGSARRARSIHSE